MVFHSTYTKISRTHVFNGEYSKSNRKNKITSSYSSQLHLMRETKKICEGFRDYWLRCNVKSVVSGPFLL
jgi:hypothetical protein